MTQASRVLAVGDLHGCTRAMDTVLDAARPRRDDLLIFLGDYVDRGPDSRGVIDRLLELRQTHQVVALRGNHDIMMLESRIDAQVRQDWLRAGGHETLASYATQVQEGNLEDVPAAHWDFLENICVNWHETDTHFFVHANVYPEVPLTEQPSYMLHWEKLHPPRRPHVSGKVMICGHTAQRSGVPLNLGHTICIDTWVYGLGYLTCLEVNTGYLWQANQGGEMRMGHIGDYLANDAD